MGVTDKLIFGNVDSSDYGVFLTGSGTFGAPERDVEYVSVPGRNGDLILDNGRWNNIEVTYPANIPFEFVDKFAAFRAAVCRQRGYQRLEDTYHPDEFRLAAFTDGFETEPTPLNKGGEFDIVFNCKPQRFLKSGEEPIAFMPIYANGPNEFSTKYIHLNGEFRLTLHCPEGATVNVTVKDYDEDYVERASITYSAQDGWTKRELAVNVFYTRIIVSGVSGFMDEVSLDISGVFSLDDIGLIDLNATLARKVRITNPTGYATKPLMKIYMPALFSFTVSNYAGDVREEYYRMRIANTGQNKFWLDCDTQYLYDEDMNNLTDKLTITTAESAIGEALVFPEFGEETIEVYMQDTSISSCMGIVLIYPRWWTL